MMKQALLAFSCLAVVAGCSSSVRYYSLEPSSTAAASANVAASGPGIELRQVRFPEYLNNPQMVLRRASGEMRVDDYHRWVEDLQPNFQRTLLSDLSALAPSSAVFSSGASAISPKYMLQLDVSRFEAAEDGSAQLWVSYTVTENGTRGAAPRAYSDRLSQPVGGRSTDARVKALSGLVQELAQRIVSRLALRG